MHTRASWSKLFGRITNQSCPSTAPYASRLTEIGALEPHEIDRFPNYCLGTSNGHDRSLRAARSLLFHTFLMDESRSDSEKMDKKKKSDDYDSPSDLWRVSN